MNTSIKLPQTIAELHSFMKTAIETFQCSSVSNKNKLNETLAKSLNLDNYDQLSAFIKNDKKSNTPSYKNETFEILDPTGEKPSRKVFITESDCDLHIKVEHYTINLQNYDGDFELTIEDSMQPSVEIENISLPCKTQEQQIKTNSKNEIANKYNEYFINFSSNHHSMCDQDKAIDILKAIINKMYNTTLSFNKVKHFIGTERYDYEIYEFADCTINNDRPITPEHILELCDGCNID